MTRRRLLIATTSFTVVVGLAGLAAWFFWVPHLRPGLAPGERFGLDVSNHQGAIDWAAVADDGIDFAFIKATEGGDFVDAFFARNWDGARDAGLDVGAYHFFTLCTPGDAQARNLLAVVPLDDMDLPIALDLEFAGNCSSRPTTAWVATEVAAFIAVVEEATGEELVLYVDKKFEDAYGTKEQTDRELWERRMWFPPGDDDWTFWQWTDRGRVDGVVGGVDINIERASPP